MTASRTAATAGVVLSLLSAGVACAPRETTSLDLPAEVLRVSDRVVVLRSLGANVTAVATEKGVVVIDTHRSPTLMEHIKRLIERELGRNDFRYVVNTHGHWDHSSGNQVFPDSEIIGHRNTPEYMKQNPLTSPRLGWYLEDRLAKARDKLEAAEEGSPRAATLHAEVKAREAMLRDLSGRYAVTPPTRTFEDRLTLDLGDTTLILLYCGENHTDNDIIAWVPEERIAVTGDLFSKRASFGFAVNNMMNVPRLLSALDEVLGHETGVRLAVPGHGELMSGDDLQATRDSLQRQYEALGDEPSAARTLQRLIDEHGIEEATRRFTGLRDSGNAGHVSEGELDILGYRLLGEGRIAEAVGAFAIAVEMVPDSALLHDGLAHAYRIRGNREEAMRHYERALELNPHDTNASEMLKALEVSKDETR